MITLKQATLADLDELVALEHITWVNNFREHYTAEDFAAYMQAHKTPEAIAQKLERPRTQCWLALEDGAAVGFLTLNLHKQPDHGGPLPIPVMEIEQIYVHPAIKGKGIGAQLFQQAYSIAKANDVRTLWLGVFEYNELAQKFYIKEGFEKFATHIFYVGTQADTDWLMKKELILSLRS